FHVILTVFFLLDFALTVFGVSGLPAGVMTLDADAGLFPAREVASTRISVFRPFVSPVMVAVRALAVARADFHADHAPEAYVLDCTVYPVIPLVPDVLGALQVTLAARSRRVTLPRRGAEGAESAVFPGADRL